eukprot:COSAG01_NODE_51209_length_356_cov_2.105058_1_plen_38_part_10
MPASVNRAYSCTRFNSSAHALLPPRAYNVYSCRRLLGE